MAIRFSYTPGAGVVANVTDPPTEPLRPLDEYAQKVQRSQARGLVYPYELIPVLTGSDGKFVEYDFDESGEFVPVDRPYGRNTAGLIVGLVTRRTPLYPEGMTRVAMFGDPTKALGTVAEAECARVVAALDLAEELSVPVEWFALSSGATISMDSGTENMDWVSRALRRIITFTQDGGEINIIVAGINVGAQPYWNAEATMLMHTKGILVMTPDSAMVLTGKQSLDYSGGVSAEDNFGIGGYDRVMGPNGQAQYWAPNLQAACDILFTHYDHAYVAPGERFPRRAETSDPVDRDVRDYPHDHPSSDFTTVGDIFADATNKDRKKPFDIRTVMRSVVDQDHPVLERWADMADADTSVVFDAHVAGIPVCVIGIESRVIPAQGLGPRRRAGPVDVGNPLPAVLQEDRSRDQRRKREPTPGGAGEPFGFRRFAGVTPQDPARARRRNRPGHRQLRRTDRFRRGFALSRRSFRGLLRRAEREHGSARGRGIVLLGYRRCTRGGGGVHPRGEQTYRSGPGRARPRSAACRQHRRRRNAPA